QRSAFSVQRSAFSVQRSAFSVQRSAFRVQRLQMFHLINLILHFPARGFDHDHIALFFADEGAGNGGADGDSVVFYIRFVVADDAVDFLLFRLAVNDGNGGAKTYLARVGNGFDIDNLRIGQLAFDFLDAAFAKALLFARGVILGVLFQIAVLARFGNG